MSTPTVCSGDWAAKCTSLPTLFDFALRSKTHALRSIPRSVRKRVSRRWMSRCVRKHTLFARFRDRFESACSPVDVPLRSKAHLAGRSERE